MQIAYPFQFDGRRRTAEASDDDHIRQMIEQLLFTTPGERVNRPDFGSGLNALVFAPTDDALAATTQMAVQAALQRWMSSLIQVEAVNVTSVDSTLTVTVQYIVRREQQRQVAQFQRTA